MNYIIKRLILSVIILFFVVFIIYAILRCLPMSYVETMAMQLSQAPGSKPYEEWLVQLNAQYGLDIGIVPGFFVQLGNLLTGNLTADEWKRAYHAAEAISNDKVQPGDVVVIRYEGPKGGPGMREMHMVTSLLVGRGMDESCALITDGRFSGSTRGPCIGHISPEAAAGGPIAIVEDGDEISINIPERKLELLVSDEEIQARLSKVQLLKKPCSGVLGKYAKLVTSADKGAVLLYD